MTSAFLVVSMNESDLALDLCWTSARTYSPLSRVDEGRDLDL